MADEQASQQDRTEQPTQKRSDEARREGQVARSGELSAAAVLLAATISLVATVESLRVALADLLKACIGLAGQLHGLSSQNELVTHTSRSLLQVAIALAPVLTAVFLAALVAPWLLGGWNFSAKALLPKFSRLSPLAGLTRMFSVRGLVELFKSILKFLLVGSFAAIAIFGARGELMSLGNREIGAASDVAGHIVGNTLFALVGAIVIIALVDAPYQFWKHRQDLKMTKDEVRREMRDSEGSPEVRGRIRMMQQMLARKRMMAAVPEADVIVTNPTHFAVALRYDAQRMRAPRVVAKGTDLVALRIREIASQHEVPVIEAPLLTRSIYRLVEIGQEIPAALYLAVAQILVYVSQLNDLRRVGTRQTLPKPNDLPADLARALGTQVTPQ
ncbi:MAG: flagellar biosynthesis protein FlhB [Steroidobacteraceae bacterium]